MMRQMFAAGLSLLAALSLGSIAQAHSLDDVETNLSKKEKYLQVINRPAPEFTLQDAGGDPVSLRDLKGQIVVLHFIYASCPDVCPLHAEKLATVQEMINATPMRDQVRFVTITTDPVQDTPEVLSDYGRVHGLDEPNWVFLTSGADRPDDTRELAEAFGHKFTVTGDGQQMHGVVTHVIDQAGTLRANVHGLEFDPTNLVVYVNALVNDPHGADEHAEPSLWDRIKSVF